MTYDRTDDDGLKRRYVLRTGAATAGAVTIGAVGAAAHHDDDHENGGNGDDGNGGSDNGNGRNGGNGNGGDDNGGNGGDGGNGGNGGNGNGNGGNGNGNGGDGGNGGKRGGRAQVDGDVRLNELFTLSDAPSSATRAASCMSEQSADQTYLEYDIEYCDDDDDDHTMYVIPDEAELVHEEVYEFRSAQECKASDAQKVAFGPSNQEC